MKIEAQRRDDQGWMVRASIEAVASAPTLHQANEHAIALLLAQAARHMQPDAIPVELLDLGHEGVSQPKPKAGEGVDGTPAKCE